MNRIEKEQFLLNLHLQHWVTNCKKFNGELKYFENIDAFYLYFDSLISTELEEIKSICITFGYNVNSIGVEKETNRCYMLII